LRELRLLLSASFEGDNRTESRLVERKGEGKRPISSFHVRGVKLVLDSLWIRWKGKKRVLSL